MTIEYILIRDANDTPRHARLLHELLADMRVKINLIPCNPAPGSPHRPPDGERAAAFVTALRELGRTAYVRRSLGPDIMAACGQLRARRPGRDDTGTPAEARP